jgi:hypothetical protein
MKAMSMKHWLEYDEAHFLQETALKKRLLAPDSESRRWTYAALPSSLHAQSELLQVVIGNLQDFHSDKFSTSETEVKVLATGQIFKLSDWKHDPLHLASLLVQEDFVLLAPSELVDYQDNGSETPVFEHIFVAGACCFTFTDTGLRGERGFMRLGEPLQTIHTPVPHFKSHLQRPMDRMLSRLEPSKPYYRSNWMLTPNSTLSPFAVVEDGSSDYAHGRTEGSSATSETPVVALAGTAPEALLLRVEYQTLIRLPKTRYIVFGLHTYLDPLPSLLEAPEAAKMLVRAIEGLTPERKKYMGMQDEAYKQVITSYLSRA